MAPRAPQDPGLQAERTQLAWTRTALALLVNSLLALRAGWSSGHGLVSALAFALILASAVFAGYGMRRRRVLSAGLTPVACEPRALAGIAFATVAACVTGALSILLAR